MKKTGSTDENNSSSGYCSSSLKDAAEKVLLHSSKDTLGGAGQTTEELVHNLQVHQIELEIQAEELKRAQIAIEESRDQYVDLYEFAPLGYLMLSETGIITQANLTAADLFGIPRKNLINTRFRGFIESVDFDQWDRYFSRLLNDGLKHVTTLTLKRTNNVPFPARLEGIHLHGRSEGQSIRVAIIDMSDIKEAEKSLRRSEERFSLALRNVPVSVTTQDRELVFQWGYNQDSGQMGDIKGKVDADIYIPEEAEELVCLKRKTLEEGTGCNEKKWLTINGRRVFLDLYLEPLRDLTGEITGIGVAAVDLTEQKNLEDALRESEKKFRRAHNLLEAVTKGTQVIIAVQDVNFQYIYFNQTYKEEIKRITGKNLTLGASMVDLYADLPEEQKMSIDEWSKVLQGENVNRVIQFHDPDNNVRIYRVLHTPIRDENGVIIGAGEVSYDVTKQVEVEDNLRETKEYLDSLITCANAPIIVWDPQFRITRFNKAFEHLTGMKTKEVIGKDLKILFPEQHLPIVIELIQKTLDGERWESVEIPILHRNGEIKTVLWNSASIYRNNGKNLISTIAQGQDITERKKMESDYRLRAEEYAILNQMLKDEINRRELSDINLKNTLSLLNASLESTADGIFVVDLHGTITSYNKNFVTMWNIPPHLLQSGRQEVILREILPQLKDPDAFLSGINDFISHPGRESFDMIEFIDGKIFERYSKPQIIDDNVEGRVWSFRDITDRKHAEEKLFASLQEKEVMLREIHHRVKNNLQLISGLLDMTRMRSHDESTYGILTDMMLKIQTMAQIHTRLYESKQIGKINIKEQIEDQCTSLSNIYSHRDQEITCEMDAPEVLLPVDLALPCALVVNEILSNSYKHAFIKRKKGSIQITVSQENGRNIIIIRDDGIGMPDEIDIRNSTSLGLKLMRTLVQNQLNGSITICSKSGTEISISFPVISKEGITYVKNTCG